MVGSWNMHIFPDLSIQIHVRCPRLLPPHLWDNWQSTTNADTQISCILFSWSFGYEILMVFMVFIMDMHLFGMVKFVLSCNKCHLLGTFIHVSCDDHQTFHPSYPSRSNQFKRSCPWHDRLLQKKKKSSKHLSEKCDKYVIKNPIYPKKNW